MSMRNSFLIAFLFAAGLLLKKMGLSAGSLLLYCSVLAVFLLSIRYAFRKKTPSNILALLGILIIYSCAVALIQYLFRQDVADGWIAFSSILIAVLLFRFSRPLPTLIILVLPLSVNIIAGSTDARNFHNIFHLMPFEAYVRAKYTYTERNVADMIINRYKNPDSEKAAGLFADAEKEAKAGNMVYAAELYNSAIDADPSNAVHYDARGFFKLSNMGLDKPNLYSALKDFERALTLDNRNASALFHHAQVLGYMNLSERACTEYRRAVELDSAFYYPDFELRNCK